MEKNLGFMKKAVNLIMILIKNVNNHVTNKKLGKLIVMDMLEKDIMEVLMKKL